MPPAPTDRGSAYLNALAVEIEKKLQRALASSTQRRNLFQELFADIALEVDDRSKEIIFGDGAISVADDGYGGPLCFYDVLSDHFISTPKSGKSILDLIVKLWTQSFAANIFALLFHKWLFEVQLDSPDVLLRYSTALVQGATGRLLNIEGAAIGIDLGTCYSCVGVWQHNRVEIITNDHATAPRRLVWPSPPTTND